jgi:hypothetical protein
MTIALYIAVIRIDVFSRMLITSSDAKGVKGRKKRVESDCFLTGLQKNLKKCL